MPDEIRATPRNQLLGLLADTLQGGANFASKPFGYDNPPVRGLLDLMGVPALTNTLNELSYGGALGTGSGMTYRPKADTLDAAMAVAPLMSAAPAAINRGAAVVGRAVEPVVNSMVNRTMANGGQGAQFLRDMAQGTQSNMFIGKGAKTWDALQAAKALELEKAGTSARQIWSETGTWRGPDGKWRQEISDKEALFNVSSVAGRRVENDLPVGYVGLDLGPTVGGILEHQPLQAAYETGLTSGTRIGNKNTMFGDGVQGSIDASGVVTINAPAKADQARSTILHELQHAIQQREGFAQGGNSMMAFLPQNKEAFALLAQKRREMQTPLSLDEYTKQAWGMDAPTDEVRKAYADYVKTTKQASLSPATDRAAQEWAGREYYRRLAGEAEARATQARIPLNASQRRAIFPEDSYDVPVNQLIVRQDGLLGPQMAIDPKAQKQLVNGLLK